MSNSLKYGGRTAVCVLVLVMGALRGEEPLSIGAGSTEARNQSKLWHHDCAWWSVLPDGADLRMYRWDGQEWKAKDIVDTRLSGRADCIANGDDLFVLVAHKLETRLYKYTYDAVAKAYDAVAGFPVPFATGGAGDRAVIDQDSTGKLWITYITGADVRVLWSTSADHKTWDTTGFVVGTSVDAGEDMASIIAFDGDKIGVFYSDVRDDSYTFRVHDDADSETTWATPETAASGPGLGDDHVNMAKSTDGDVYATVKSKSNRLYLLHRDPVAGWSAEVEVARDATRPHIVIDKTNSEFYFMYTDLNPAPSDLKFKKAPLGDPGSIETATEMVFIEVDSVAVNNFTSTKQFVDGDTGLLGTASGGGLAYSTWLPLAGGSTGGGSSLNALINFQPSGSTVPTGYQIDNGDEFTAGRGYGWIGDDLTTKERNFNPDQRLDTYVQINNTSGPLDWEFELDDGTYTVNLVAGSPLFSGIHHVELEGVTVIDAAATTQSFVEVTGQTVNVTDGRLTMTIGDPAIGRRKTKICYIEIIGGAGPGNCFRQITATALASTLSGEAPLTVEFMGEAVAPNSTIVSYLWDFDDGTPTSTDQNPTHIFAALGTYDVLFTAEDADGNVATSTVTIEVTSTVAVTASATPDSGAAPLDVDFTATATSGNGAITGWSWAFGDGGTSTLQNPSHTYTGSGTFVASVQATDAIGNTGIQTVTVTVFGAATATAAASTTLGNTPLVVDFTGTGSSTNGAITGWFWDFDDGNTSIAQNPSHTYIVAGTYTAMLTATDALGATATDTVVIVVNTPPPAGGTVALINFQPASAPVPAGYSVDTGAVFDAGRGYGWIGGALANKQRNVHSDARLDTYVLLNNTAGPADWEFALANGDYLVTAVVGAPLFTAINTLSIEGTKVVDAVFTQANFIETIDFPVTVTDGRLTLSLGDPAIGTKKSKIEYVIIKVAAPTGAITLTAGANPSSGDTPFQTDFTASASSSAGSITGYSWTFGDGGTSTVQNPTHTYNTAGTYNAQVTASDSSGNTLFKTVVVQALGTPSATASAAPTGGGVPLTVNFTGTASSPNGAIVAWSWTFGDGSSSTDQNPAHVYSIAGNYTVELTVTDDAGKTATDSLTISATGGSTGVVARINFQPAGSTVPAGYSVDSGQTFTAARGYGWIGTSLGNKDRDSDPDQRLDTYVFLSNVDGPADWEYVLPNGNYVVTVVVGSPVFTAINTLDIEGATVVDNVATAGSFEEVIDHAVTVTDGRLTLSLGDPATLTKKSKINYIIIRTE